uniref:hypothetical protein n=1 Tax=Arsenophonus nasoniae TaxID=638 RepID=UPI001083C20D|nr:hypothetical protein [Arsenophonus nasoniae]
MHPVATLNAHRYLCQTAVTTEVFVVHHYYDHRTGLPASAEDSAAGRHYRHMSYSGWWHFKMVRYSGFLSNRNGENYCRKCIRHLR